MSKTTSVQKTLERIRKLCFALPETTERVSHGAPCFFIREKPMYAMFQDNHHGDGRLAVWCAAPDGAQEALVASDSERFFRPPYVGHRGWIGVRLEEPDWGVTAAVLEDAYRHVAPRKLLGLLGG